MGAAREDVDRDGAPWPNGGPVEADVDVAKLADRRSSALERRARQRERAGASIEVLLCSGFPTQIALTYLLALAGHLPYQHGRLSLAYVLGLALGDAAILLGLIFSFLWVHGERGREMFLGDRPVSREALIGAPLIPMVFLFGVTMLAAIQRFAPWLHNVARNPLEDLIRSPRDAWLFAVVAILAGGLKEEVQRAFILRRFERHLGGGTLGLIVFSLLFGVGHLIQGWDAALVTAVLGAFWGLIYLRRRSLVAPVVSHSGFNAAEIIFYGFYGAHAVSG